jgi:hypothetical protein
LAYIKMTCINNCNTHRAHTHAHACARVRAYTHIIYNCQVDYILIVPQLTSTRNKHKPRNNDN